MKKTNLTFILIFIIQLSSIKAQYVPFPTDNATWTNIHYIEDFQITESGRSHFGLMGDTMINGQQYSKMYFNPSFSNGEPNTYRCFNPATSFYRAAIREDDNKKVWYISNNETEEFLLYDFNLAVADTFCFSIEQPSTGGFCFPVVSVDSVLINGTYRKRIHFEDANGSESWIEGIGSTTALLLAQWTLIGNVSSSIECFYEGEDLIYGDSTFCSCAGLGTAIDQDFDNFRNLKIYPIPFSDQINIDFSLDRSAMVQINIYHSTGKKVHELQRNLQEGIQEININKSLMAGIYYVSLTIEGTTRTSKIIKY